MGSPDPHGRQLNGMGGGISSLSKVCVVGPSLRPDADVDYTFIQVGVKDGSLDMAGNCGNMLSAIGPFALDSGLVPSTPAAGSDATEKDITVRIFNTNTEKVVHSKFAVFQENDRLFYDPRGTYAIDGVPETASCITLTFFRPGGSKTGVVMPSGKPSDQLRLPDGRSVRASCIDVANAGVFVRASDVGVQLSGPATTNVEADQDVKDHLETIRQAGARIMGLDPMVQSIPKIVLVAEPNSEQDADVVCLAMSMGQVHKAVPLTLALNLAATANIPGSVVWDLSKRSNPVAAATVMERTVTIAHPSGRLQVQATTDGDQIISASITRTARLMMQGEVFYT